MTEQDDEPVIQEFTAIRRGMVITRDAAGRIVNAYVPNPFVVDQLYELEIINGEQRLAAMHFIAMRRLFLRDVASFSVPTQYQTPGDMPDAPKYPITDMDSLKVLRFMRHRHDTEIVMAACDEHASLSILYQLSHPTRKQYVTTAFKSLNEAVQQLMKIKEQQAEADAKAREADSRIAELSTDK